MSNLIEIVIKASGGASVGAETNKAESALAGLGKAALGIAGGLGLAVGTRELIAFTGESMELAAAQKDARNALTNTLGSASAYAGAIERARDITRGMASETKLASNINTLLNMGLAQNAEEAARLALAGETLGKVYEAAGGSAEKYFMLLSGGSLQLYNNFALTQKAVNARKAEIEAAGELSGEEARLQAIKELTLAEAERYNGALSDETVQAAQTQAAAQDLKAAWGELVDEFIYGTGIAGRAAEALRGLKDIITGNDEAQRKQAQDILEASDSYREYTRAMMQSGLQARTYSKAQYDAVKAFLASGQASGEYEHETRMLKAAETDLAAVQRDMNAALDDTHHKMLLLSSSTVGMESSVKVLAYAMGQVGQVSPGLAAQAESAVEKHNQAIKDNAEEMGRTWQKSMETAADRMKSTIESVLGQTTLAEVWKPPEADTSRIDENARRLATVATSGFGSEWLQQLNTQFAGMSFWQPIADAMQGGDEGALKEAATQILTGPDVSKLWDIELIKQKVREQLQADNVRQQLIDTIQQELAGEGTAATTVQVGAAIGMEQEAPAGMDMSPLAGDIAGGLSGALPAAITDAAMGPTIIQAIREQIKGDEKQMKLLADALADRLDDYLPGAIGITANTFLEALTNNVAARLGIAAEIRP